MLLGVYSFLVSVSVAGLLPRSLSPPTPWQPAVQKRLRGGLGSLQLREEAGSSLQPSSPRERHAVNAASAARWHRARRQAILAAHPEVRELLSADDTWVLSLGAVLLPAFASALARSPEMSPAELAGVVVGLGSLRATWAVYCGHAISHGRWSKVVGQFGTARFNAALAATQLGHALQVLPSYWLLHQSHHTKLGSLTQPEARLRARQGRQTDGDLGIASRLFSPPARRYRLPLTRDGATVLPRQNEAVHQSLSVVAHAAAPVVFGGYFAAALRSSEADPKLRRSLAAQAAGSLATYALVAALALQEASPAPLLLYLASSLEWLSPLNPNWLWTSPHICAPGSEQPTVSFYTPDTALGALLDVYMGYENYHVEHHDFPEMPMYLLPRLRKLAPEHYAPLRQMPVSEWRTWREALLRSNFTYACQDVYLR